MHVVLSNAVALNPHIIRVEVYAYTGDLESGTDSDFMYYELAIPIEEFTTNTDGNVAIDGAKFQEVISKRIIDSNNAANIAVFLDKLNLEWDIVSGEKTVEKDILPGTSLAYGENNGDNT